MAIHVWPPSLTAAYRDKAFATGILCNPGVLYNPTKSMSSKHELKFTSLADYAYYWARDLGLQVIRAAYARDGSFLVQYSPSLIERFSLKGEDRIVAQTFIRDGKAHPAVMAGQAYGPELPVSGTLIRD